MKTPKQLYFFFIFFIVVTSCQKSVDINEEAITKANDEKANDLFKRNNCLVIHTEDDLQGSVIDFFYNKIGNPDSLNFNGTSIINKYDKWGRLIKQTFGDYGWFDFTYKAYNPFPVSLNYYRLDFGGLIAIDSFRYNRRGEMISRIGTNLLLPQYNYIEHYSYNSKGNVVKVVIAAHNGGTVFNPGYTEFIASEYDTEPNFASGSIWTKFLMFHSEYDGWPFLWMLFSRTNAASYDWIQNSEGSGITATSTFKYNSKGFADSINIHFYDDITGEDYGIFTRASSSTCDNLTLNPFGQLSIKFSLLQKRIGKINKGLPDVIHKRQGL